MISYRDLSAGIRVDGAVLPHFQPEYDDQTRTVTCWIASQAGRKYSVCWKQEKNVAPGFGGFIAGRIFLDGSKDMSNGAVTSFASPYTERGTAPMSSTEERPVMFAEIILTGMPPCHAFNRKERKENKLLYQMTNSSSSPLCKPPTLGR